MTKICAADSMCLSLLVLTQLFFEGRTVGASQTGANRIQREIAIQGHSPTYQILLRPDEKNSLNVTSQFSSKFKVT